MEPRLTARRRNPRWRRMQCLTSILGAAALLAAVGLGSVFAADPLPTASEPIVGIVDPIEVEDPAADQTDGLETRADGSIWWCPPTTGRFQLRMPCRMISPPTDVTVPPAPTPGTGLETRPDGSVWWCPPTTGRFQLLLACRMISPPTGAITGAEDATAPESDNDDSNPDLVAIADTESTLPATDTDPAFSQDPMDPRTAPLLALVLTTIAWGAAQRREAPSNR